MDVTTIRSPSNWEKRTKMEKRLIIALILAVIISMALMFALIFARPIIVIAQNSDHGTHENKCLTAGCIKAAGQILERLDDNIDPCDDFYKFVCGNYIKKTIIPPNKPFVNLLESVPDKIKKQLHVAVEQPVKTNEVGTTSLIKNYYKACINKTLRDRNTNEFLMDVLNQTSNWAVLNGEQWSEEEFDWKNLMYKNREKGLNTDSFIITSVENDPKNSSKHIIKIKPPDFTFLKTITEGNFTKPYHDFIVEIAVLLGANRQRSLEEELWQSLEFEIKLYNLSLSEANEDEAVEISINDMQQKYSNIPWLEYVNGILSTDEKLNNNEVVLLESPSYVSLFENLIEETPKRIQANHAVWKTIQKLIPYLNEEFKEAQQKFLNITNAHTENLPKWQECINEATNRLPILANSLYVHNYFNASSKDVALEIVGYMRQTFNGVLKNLDWMDEGTQRTALDKAKAIKEYIGYGNELLDSKKLREFYKKLNLNSENYLQSYLNINRFEMALSNERLHKNVSKSDWTIYANSFAPNAKYIPQTNSIVFSAGFLQELFFNIDRPYYMNFGTFGSMIGHELAHSIDDLGKNYDKNGLIQDWWASKTKQLFARKSKCIINQYENYTQSELDIKVNGEHTKDETIADNAGVKQAYFAYKSWVKSTNNQELKLPGIDYTPKQLFWISYAMQWCTVYKTGILKEIVNNNTHPPYEYKVLGSLSNSEHFSDDFNCITSTRMNPNKKCSIW